MTKTGTEITKIIVNAALEQMAIINETSIQIVKSALTKGHLVVLKDNLL